jgi:hypothetical protein
MSVKLTTTGVQPEVTSEVKLATGTCAFTITGRRNKRK